VKGKAVSLLEALIQTTYLLSITCVQLTDVILGTFHQLLGCLRLRFEGKEGHMFLFFIKKSKKGKPPLLTPTKNNKRCGYQIPKVSTLQARMLSQMR
jgi:hypothetical protein